MLIAQCFKTDLAEFLVSDPPNVRLAHTHAHTNTHTHTHTHTEHHTHALTNKHKTNVHTQRGTLLILTQERSRYRFTYLHFEQNTNGLPINEQIGHEQRRVAKLHAKSQKHNPVNTISHHSYFNTMVHPHNTRTPATSPKPISSDTSNNPTSTTQTGNTHTEQ